MIDPRPIADVESVAEKQRRAVADRLRRMMERKWNDPQVINPRRRNRFVMPIKLGGTHGYEDDIFAW